MSVVAYFSVSSIIVLYVNKSDVIPWLHREKHVRALVQGLPVSFSNTVEGQHLTNVKFLVVVATKNLYSMDRHNLNHFKDGRRERVVTA